MDEQEKRRYHLGKAIRSIDYGNNWERFARALRGIDGASPYTGEDIRRRINGEVRIDTEFVNYVARTTGFSRRFLAGDQDHPLIDEGISLRFDPKDVLLEGSPALRARSMERALLRPNNRLQGMRGLACFGWMKVLRDGPAPLTLVSFGGCLIALAHACNYVVPCTRSTVTARYAGLTVTPPGPPSGPRVSSSPKPGGTAHARRS